MKSKTVSMIVALAVIFGGFGKPLANSSVDYLKSQILTDWSVITLSATNSLDGVNLGILETDPGQTPTDIERKILARSAAGANSDRLVSRLSGYFNGTEIANPAVPGLLSDDIFGVLALSSANARPEIRAALADFIKAGQNPNGGWSHFVDGQPNSDFTAMAIMALISAGENSNSDTINRGFAFLEQCDTGAGFSHFSGQGADAYSTSWVVPAYRAANKPLPSGAAEYLAAFMENNGSFDNSTVLTAHALIALNSKYYPVIGQATIPPPADTESPAQESNPVNERQIFVTIHGPSGIIHQGNISGAANALETITKSGIAHQTRNTPFGIYIQSIAGIAESGLNGWMYTVNGGKPGISTAHYALSANDQVVWFYGGPNDTGPGTENINANLPAGEQTSASVLLSAEITNPIPSSSETAEATANPNRPPIIIFGVDTSSVNFGQLRPGDNSPARPVKLTNSGNVNLDVTTALSNADPLFHQGLYIESNKSSTFLSGYCTPQEGYIEPFIPAASCGVFWKVLDKWSSFSAPVNAHSEKNVNLSLRVPSDFQSLGHKNGTLIFWATAK
ncbi:MAG: hypothetical protein A3K05_03050 [Candidatus Doudnabacteria bacterium RIFCSPHIGHO2_01_48_18]|uniref:Transcobalamin-like C-terminal domain-containing protein n=1 Tax=Candidatus Doudnabacteria bacterium RIFCSPLOWO2_02_FULL_48_13 TaxID=1817845 RepID=A0A1F5Q8W0_9BACT|nr:MAG: hypothetical protein A3K05_03050 [Candidatus Doudnabacteria bacterium RIFCSPHIGHO2_01_48_18]OGE78754.1 MAG: hypothetical protein A2668_02345 [Candidatus Doudnabacteria bacterium RIFCSPHIGHO2_01_FULL_48_180]OGE98624.1 MAG: hypothetical protein A3J05_00970 [Candidatus Doudnabacteria bacterium RIFCSPLOWO2_02_FULL_48_13]